MNEGKLEGKKNKKPIDFAPKFAIKILSVTHVFSQIFIFLFFFVCDRVWDRKLRGHKISIVISFFMIEFFDQVLIDYWLNIYYSHKSIKNSSFDRFFFISPSLSLLNSLSFSSCVVCLLLFSTFLLLLLFNDLFNYFFYLQALKKTQY